MNISKVADNNIRLSSVNWPTDRLTGWLANNQLTDLLTEWMVDCLTDWLNVQHHIVRHKNSFSHNLTQSNTHQSAALQPMSIDVKGDSGITWISGRWPEVRGEHITTPTIAPLITIFITRYEKSRVEAVVTDKKLVFMTCGSYTSTQPQAGDLRLVICLCDETGIKFIGKESLFIRGLIHKENFPKLQAIKKKQNKKEEQRKTLSCWIRWLG